MTHAQFRQYKPPKRRRPVKKPGKSWLSVLRGWLPIFLLLLLSAASVQLWRLAMRPDTLPFKDIKVTANYNHISRQQLRQAIQAELHSGFFSLNVVQLKQSLQEKLPWIDSLVVRRVWPDVLRVAVIEQKAIANWNGQQLINSRGELFSPEVGTFPEGLPKLFGQPDSFSMVLSEYRQATSLLARLHLQVKQLSLTDRQAWHLQLSNDVVVMMGKDNPDQRLLRFIKVYPELLASHAGGFKWVDLRYPNGFAVK